MLKSTHTQSKFKNVFLFSIFFLFAYVVSCQENVQYVNYKSNYSDVIIEGKVKSINVKFDSLLRYNITIYEIDVSKQFRS